MFISTQLHFVIEGKVLGQDFNCLFPFVTDSYWERSVIVSRAIVALDPLVYAFQASLNSETSIEQTRLLALSVNPALRASAVRVYGIGGGRSGVPLQSNICAMVPRFGNPQSFEGVPGLQHRIRSRFFLPSIDESQIIDGRLVPSGEYETAWTAFLAVASLDVTFGIVYNARSPVTMRIYPAVMRKWSNSGPVIVPAQRVTYTPLSQWRLKVLRSRLPGHGR